MLQKPNYEFIRDISVVSGGVNMHVCCSMLMVDLDIGQSIFKYFYA